MEIEKLILEIYKKFSEKDWDFLRNVHLNDPRFSKWTDGKDAVIGYDETVEEEIGIFSQLGKFDYKVKNLKVDDFGSIAIASFVLSYDAVLGDTALQASERGTLVFLKTDEGWKIVHEHASILPSEEKK